MKKYNMKNLLLGLGTVAAVATPVIAVVSCGSDDDSTNEKSQNGDKTENNNPAVVDGTGNGNGEGDDLYGDMFGKSQLEIDQDNLLKTIQSWGILDGVSTSAFVGGLLGYAPDILTQLSVDGHSFTKEQWETFIDLAVGQLPTSMSETITPMLGAIKTLAIPMLINNWTEIQGIIRLLQPTNPDLQIGDIINAYLGKISGEDHQAISIPTYLLTNLDFDAILNALPSIVEGSLLASLLPVLPTALSFAGIETSTSNAIAEVLKDKELLRTLIEVVNQLKGDVKLSDLVHTAMENPVGLLGLIDLTDIQDITIDEASVTKIVGVAAKFFEIADADQTTLSTSLHYVLTHASELSSVVNSLLGTHTIDELIASGSIMTAISSLDFANFAISDEMKAHLGTIATVILDNIVTPEGATTPITESLAAIIPSIKANGIIPTLTGNILPDMINPLFGEGEILDVLLSSPLKELVKAIFSHNVIGKLSSEGLQGSLEAGGTETDIAAGIISQLPESYAPMVEGILKGFGEGTDKADATTGLGKIIAAIETMSPGLTTAPIQIGMVPDYVEQLFNRNRTRVAGVRISHYQHSTRFSQNGLLSLTEAELAQTVQSIVDILPYADAVSGMVDLTDTILRYDQRSCDIN